jgi:hypothetical protein
MKIKLAIKQLARKLGVEMHWYTPAQSQHARLFKLLAHHVIDTVIDVGANDGVFGRSLREGGFRGRILSFEPLEDAHCSLTAVASGDADWYVAPRMDGMLMFLFRTMMTVLNQTLFRRMAALDPAMKLGVPHA